MQIQNTKFVFFGTPEFSVIILDELKAVGFVPSLIVTREDKPKGRNLVLTPPEVKVWAEKENVPYVQPKKLDEEFVSKLSALNPEFFIVASYGKIIPESVLSAAKRGALNVHPSLLPKLRGASPIESAIVRESETGMTIIKLDSEMDHGPILAQETTAAWDSFDPPYFEQLEKDLAHHGGKLLGRVLPDWLGGGVQEKEQDHTQATLCGKMKKEDGLLDLGSDPETNIRKIRAYHIWPTAYFFQDGKRIIVKKAHVENNTLVIDRIIPEGKKEMNYEDFVKNLKS